MKFFRKTISVLIACAMLVPYSAFAANESDNVNVIEPIGNFRLFGESDGESSVTELTAEEKVFVQYVVEQIAATHASTIEIPEDKTIPVSQFTQTLCQSIVNDMQVNHPELFYIDPESLRNFGGSKANNKVAAVTIPQEAYSMTDEEITAAQEMIDEEVERIIAPARPLATDLEKVLYVHDCIVSNYRYDTDYKNRTLYTMVRDKKGVCHGYTYLFMVAMHELGVECISVPTDELAHIWNKVKIDGKWYNIDLTYDDPVTAVSSSVIHDFFLVNDEEIKELDPSDRDVYLYLIGDTGYEILLGASLLPGDDEDTYTVKMGDKAIIENGVAGYDEDGNIIITGEKYSVLYVEKENSCHVRWNAFDWDGSPVISSDSTDFSQSRLHTLHSNTVLANNTFYGFDADNNICEIGFDDGIQTFTPVYTNSADFKWNVYKGNGTWDLAYSSFAQYRDRIYFNSPDKIFEFDPDTPEIAKSVYEYNGDKEDASKTYFYGLKVVDDKLIADFVESPNDKTSEDIEIPIKPPIEALQSEPVFTAGEDGSITVTAPIPEAYNDYVTIYVAEYDENGAFIGFAQEKAGEPEAVLESDVENTDENTDDNTGDTSGDKPAPANSGGAHGDTMEVTVVPSENAAVLKMFVWVNENGRPLTGAGPYTIVRGSEPEQGEPEQGGGAEQGEPEQGEPEQGGGAEQGEPEQGGGNEQGEPEQGGENTEPVSQPIGE